MLPRIARASYAACSSKSLRRAYSGIPSNTTTSISTTTSPSSWSSGQTFKKVTAYPFTVDPEHAQSLMDAQFYIASSKRLRSVYTGQFGLTSRLVQLYMPYKERHNPIRVKAVYVPVWRFYAFAKVSIDRPPYRVVVTMPDSYIPGTHTPSHFGGEAFWDFPSIELLETAPIGDCLKPYGMEAQCLPFTISPFAPLDLAKKLGSKPVAVNGKSWKFIPNSITPQFYAAFPVMVPVYTCEYDNYQHEVGVYKKKTLVCEAFGMKPRVANLQRVKSAFEAEDAEIKVVKDYSLSENVKKLAEMPPLKSDDDACIRPLLPAEVAAVRRLAVVRDSFLEWLRLDETGLPNDRRKKYAEELVARDNRMFEYRPSWWYQSKLAGVAPRKPPTGKSGLTKSRSSPI